MQLAANRDGNRRELELQLEPVRNRKGEIMGYYDPDVADGIDRLFVRIWTPENMIMGKATYVCFLDCKDEDTVSTLKTKVQQHPNLAHMGLQNVILLYKGRTLGDAETLPQCEIDDDCILHAVNGNDAFFNVHQVMQPPPHQVSIQIPAAHLPITAMATNHWCLQ